MDVAAGMCYLHSINLLHGDLKSANVLLRSCSVTDGDPRGFTCKVSCLPPPLFPCPVTLQSQPFQGFYRQEG